MIFVSINELDMNWMRRHKIGYVEQEPELLNETLRENIIQDSSFSNEYYKKLLKKTPSNRRRKRGTK